MNKVSIVPTNTCPPDFSELTRRSEMLAEFSPEIQLDVADGLFAPVSSWPYNDSEDVVRMSSGSLRLPFLDRTSYEIHLMVEEPREIGVQLAKAGASRILGHIESFATETEAHGALDAWKQNGAREVGLALLMHTPFEVVEPLIRSVDLVQLMTIASIGAQGAMFDPGAVARVADFHSRFPDTILAVDGGVSESTIQDLARAGASRFGVGSAITKAADPAVAYQRLLELAEAATRT